MLTNAPSSRPPNFARNFGLARMSFHGSLHPTAAGTLVALVVSIFAIGSVLGSAPSAAQEWPPERLKVRPQDRSKPPSTRPDRSPPPADTFGGEAPPAAIERGDLAPVMATDGSGLPFELWRGLDLASVEGLISELEIPPRSPALHSLWTRLITSDVTPPSGAADSQKFSSLRLEALYRSGLAADAATKASSANDASDPLLTILTARNTLAGNKADDACAMMKTASLQGEIPARLKGQAIMMTGYCAARGGNPAAAGLAAEMAREEGQQSTPGLEALDAISIGSKARFSPVKTVTLIDYRLAEKAGGIAASDVLEHGEPALLVALANDHDTPADIGLAASEAATRLNGLSPETLAAIYRANGQAQSPDELLSGKSTAGGPLHRASLFKAMEVEQTPMRKLRLAQAFINAMKRERLGFQAMQMVAPTLANVTAQPELGWFAETAAEIGVVAARYDMTRQWTLVASDPGIAANGGLEHWLALADIADSKAADHTSHLPALERLALAGKFEPAVLHRLVTVLDALLTQIPIPLWDAASRTPQPSGGYLPETGVLSQLQDAAKKREFGRTVLLAMKSLGPSGAEGANMIALGDSIRALKRAGLEADARRVGLEALLAGWPRLSTN